ncbi:hypothetical protein WA158_002512 [Blastocystis sp. Blastoise]
MNQRAPKKKVPVKSVFHHVIRAKLFGVLTLNSLEGMMHELDNLIPVDLERDNIDTFSEELRRYHNGSLMPTSHGDHLDRAMKSLAKELGVPVSVELLNTQAVKKVIMTIAKGASETEKNEILEWLNQPNEVIMKSPRYDTLIDHACMFFYKKPANEVSDDTLAFVRRSANELLRNKASKEAMRKRLSKNDSDLLNKDLDNMGIEDEDSEENSDSSDDEAILGKTYESPSSDMDHNKSQKRKFLPPNALPVNMLSQMAPTPQGVVSMPVEDPQAKKMKGNVDVQV